MILSMLNEKGIGQIFPIILIVFILTIGGSYYYNNYYLSNSTIQQHSDNLGKAPLITNPIPTTSPLAWETYADEEIGFEIKYPENTLPQYKDRLPTKQYLSNDLSEGYILLLVPDQVGKGNLFRMIARKKSPGFNLMDYWKKHKINFLYDECSEKVCKGKYQGSEKEWEFKLSQEIINGKNAISIIDLEKNYGVNEKPSFTQWLIIDLNPKYVLEIHKGELEIPNTVLSTLRFF